MTEHENERPEPPLPEPVENWITENVTPDFLSPSFEGDPKARRRVEGLTPEQRKALAESTWRSLARKLLDDLGDSPEDVVKGFEEIREIRRQREEGQK